MIQRYKMGALLHSLEKEHFLSQDHISFFHIFIGREMNKRSFPEVNSLHDPESLERLKHSHSGSFSHFYKTQGPDGQRTTIAGIY